MVPVVQANGHKLAVFYVLKADKNGGFPINQIQPIDPPRRAAAGGQGVYQRFYLFNDSGNVTGDTFTAMAEQISNIWSTLHPGLYAYLTLDNLGAHQAPAALAHFLHGNIRLVFLPKNATHLYQALDGTPFAIVTKTVGKRKRDGVHEKLLNGDAPSHTRSEIVQYAMESENTAISIGVVKKAFKVIGLHPWNPEHIITLAKENAGGASTCVASDAAHADLTAHAVALFKKKKESTSPAPSKIKMTTNVCVTDLDLAARIADKRAAKEAEEEEKEQRRKDREEAAAAKEAEKARKAEKRLDEAEEKLRRDAARLEAVRKKRIDEAGGRLPGRGDEFWRTHCRRCLKKWVEASRRKSVWSECEYECGSFTMCYQCSEHKEGESAMSKHESACGKRRRRR
jgi:hypothetical protein